MKERIKNVMERVFKITEISDDISRYNCDKWDSLNLAFLVVELEIEFKVIIEPKDISEMTSLVDIERILNKLINH